MLTDQINQTAEAWKMLGRLGYIDGIFNHISTSWVGEAGEFIAAMNPFGPLANNISSESFVQFELLGNVTKAGPPNLNQDGYALHRSLHQARGKPGTVLHTHSRAVAAVSASKAGLLPISQAALEFCSDVVYFEYDGLFRGQKLVPGLAKIAQTGGCAILRNHGLLIVADSVPEVFYCAYYLEEACAIQCFAPTRSKELIIPRTAIVSSVRAEMIADRSENARIMFEAFRSHLL